MLILGCVCGIEVVGEINGLVRWRCVVLWYGGGEVYACIPQHELGSFLLRTVLCLLTESLLGRFLRVVVVELRLSIRTRGCRW